MTRDVILPDLEGLRWPQMALTLSQTIGNIHNSFGRLCEAFKDSSWPRSSWNQGPRRDLGVCARDRGCASSGQKRHTEVTDKGSKPEAMQAGTVQSVLYRQLPVMSSWVANGDALRGWTIWNHQNLDKYLQFHIVQPNKYLQRLHDSPDHSMSVRRCTFHMVQCVCHMSTSFMFGASAHLGHWSLGVTFPARLNSGTSVGSPGLLRLWAALSLTCCSITARSVGSGGTGFTGSSPGSDSFISSGRSSTACLFFFFLALCWVRGNLMSGILEFLWKA